MCVVGGYIYLEAVAGRENCCFLDVWQLAQLPYGRDMPSTRRLREDRTFRGEENRYSSREGDRQACHGDEIDVDVWLFAQR